MSEYQKYIDSLILDKLRSDDEDVINQLFKHYYNLLFRAGLRWCSDIQITEESIMDIFLDLWVYRQSLGNIISFESYLKASLRRRIFKKFKNNGQIFLQDEIDINSDYSILTTESYEDILIKQQSDEERRQKLLKSLNLLTPKQKQIIHLKYFEELTYVEIGQRTGLEIGTLYKLLHDAIKKLKLILEKK